MTCSIEGCDKRVVSRGWCMGHYRRWQMHGDPNLTSRDVNPLCSVEACRSIARVRGWCGKHYQVWANHGDVNYKRPTAQDSSCTIEGCDTKIHSKGLCSMHYRRNRVHGDPNVAWPNRRTDRICTVEGCDRSQKTRTYCDKHYQVWRAHGDAGYVRPKGEVPHGTLTGYGMHGCRCDLCRAAQAQSNRRNQLRANFGITPEDYDRMWAAQGGVCAICRLEGSGRLSGRLMAVDHDHTTGKVRGLLCQRCNHAVGLLHDSPDRAMALAAYLLQSIDLLREVSE